jgi:F420H(2)-dependent quinone reductase
MCGCCTTSTGWLSYRLTRGRHTFSSWLSGLPVVMPTTGAKTGQQRTSPVIGVPGGDNLVVVASIGGSASIRPGTTPQPVRASGGHGQSRPFLAARPGHEAVGEERDRLFPWDLEVYPG